MSNDRTLHSAGAPADDDADAVIRELRIRVGLLQSELEHMRREHAALKSTLAQDIAALARRYLDAGKQSAPGVRHIDGVIFGGWDRAEGTDRIASREDDRGIKSA